MNGEKLFGAGLHGAHGHAEHDSLRTLPHLPETCDVRATVDWMHAVLAGVHAIPAPLANQLACCLYASGYADDLNQAKAIVAVDALA